MKYRVLCADPAWPFKDKLPGKGRGAGKNYELTAIRELCRFPLPAMHDDSVLFMWRVSAMQAEALKVIDAWGFTVKTDLVWLKKTTDGQRWFGMGRTLRAEHETCIVATRGNPIVKNHSTRSTFLTDLDLAGLSAPFTGHSVKPERFYDIVESLFDGPYVELFARRQRPGWTCLGNEMQVTE